MLLVRDVWSWPSYGLEVRTLRKVFMFNFISYSKYFFHNETMTNTLHTSPGNFRAFKALIAAEYCGVDITISDDLTQIGSLSPVGKAPVLVTPKGNIWESNAIARHVARIGKGDSGLNGQNMYEAAEIDGWIDFGSNELELPACVWWYPIAGYIPYNEKAYSKAKIDLAAAFGKIECHLFNGQTFLVGQQITLADICVASALVYPMKLVCDASFLEPFPNVSRWFKMCVDQSEFKSIIGDVRLCEKELLAPNSQ